MTAWRSCAAERVAFGQALRVLVHGPLLDFGACLFHILRELGRELVMIAGNHRVVGRMSGYGTSLVRLNSRV